MNFKSKLEEALNKITVTLVEATTLNQLRKQKCKSEEARDKFGPIFEIYDTHLSVNQKFVIGNLYIQVEQLLYALSLSNTIEKDPEEHEEDE